MSLVPIAVAIGLVAVGAALRAVDRSLERVSRSRAETLAEEGVPWAASLGRLVDHLGRAHDTLAMLSLLAWVGASGIVLLQLSPLVHGAAWWAAVPGVALGFFVVERIVARLVRQRGAERLALRAAPYAGWLVRFFAWLAVPLSLPAAWIVRSRMRGPPDEGSDVPPELRELIDRAEAGEVIERDEARLISRSFEFADTIVREVMTPRPDVVALPVDATVEEALACAVDRGISRIPVYKEGLDDVVGVLYVKDLLRRFQQERRRRESSADGGGTIRPIIRDAHFVPEQKRTAQLLKDMRDNRYHIAIVIDEYGGVSGVVSMEDLLEELVGEISDEYDPEEKLIEAGGDGVYRVAARMGLDDLGDVLDTEFSIEGADTVGGAVLALLGRVPEEGAKVHDPRTGVTFEALRVTGHRVEDVMVTRS